MVTPLRTTEVPFIRPSPSSTTAALSVSIVRTDAGFEALRGQWDALLEDSEARVFQTFEWISTWWKVIGRSRGHREPYIIVLHADGILVGIAPLFLERVPVFGLLRYRRLTFMGRDTSDYLDILARRGWESHVVESLATHLIESRRTFDVLLLEDITDGSPTHERLTALLLAQGFTGDRFLSEYCPRTYFGRSWEETAAAFPKSHRNRLLRRMQTVTEESGLDFEHVTDPAKIPAAMDEFIAMHQARWNVLGHQGVFGEPATDRFHREVAPHLHRRGWLLLAFFTRNGERLVGDYGLVFRDECATYLGGSAGDPELMRLSPGNVLLMTIMKKCHSMNIRVYDFLRGTERYKYNLGAVDVPNWTLLMYSHRGRYYSLLHRAGLLSEALVRRLAYEWSSFRVQTSKHGFVSIACATYVLGRLRTVISDAIQKMRTPEKTLIIARDQQ
jgi:CelD/BcsL family acetyltransferase involved in cellulose biosynthesis